MSTIEPTINQDYKYKDGTGRTEKGERRRVRRRKRRENRSREKKENRGVGHDAP